MNEIFFNGKLVKDVEIQEDHEDGELESRWFETGLVDKVEVLESGGTLSFKHYLSGELHTERLIHLSKIASMKVVYFTKHN